VHLSGSYILNFPLSLGWGMPKGQTSAQIPQPVHKTGSIDILGRVIDILIEDGFRAILNTSFF